MKKQPKLAAFLWATFGIERRLRVQSQAESWNFFAAHLHKPFCRAGQRLQGGDLSGSRPIEETLLSVWLGFTGLKLEVLAADR